MIKPQRLIEILGKSIDDPAVERLKKELGDVEVDELPDIIYSSYDHGVEMHFDSKVLGTIMLYSEAPVDADDYKAYPYPLPHSLKFSMKSAEVRATLGKPTKSPPGTDFYELKDHVLYVEYRSKTKTINSVTLMSLEKYAE